MAHEVTVLTAGELRGLVQLDLAAVDVVERAFAALASGVGARGVVVRSLADLDQLADWAAQPADDRSFLVLDCRVSRDVVAPYQEEIIRVNS